MLHAPTSATAHVVNVQLAVSVAISGTTLHESYSVTNHVSAFHSSCNSSFTCSSTVSFVAALAILMASTDL